MWRLIHQRENCRREHKSQCYQSCPRVLQGPLGLVGAQGNQGPEGEEGTQGPQGLGGVQGNQGPSGSSGEGIHACGIYQITSEGAEVFANSPGLNVVHDPDGPAGQVLVTFPSCPPGQVPILIGSTTSGEAVMVSNVEINDGTTTVTVKTNNNSVIFFQVICCEGKLPPFGDEDV